MIRGRGPIKPYRLSSVTPFQDFRQATQVHSYRVKIDCPQRIARLGVRNEELCNRLGEKMRIDVGKDPTAINTAGQLLDEVRVVRLPPS